MRTVNRLAAVGLIVAGTVTVISAPASAAARCQSGPYQRAVEGHLAQLGGFGPVSVDGRQSAADCAAIVRFQQRYDIRPATGLAGPTTREIARRLAGTDTRACRAPARGVTICIDLTRQTVWAMRDGALAMKPTVARTGMRRYATPTGTFRVNKRATREWSDPYRVWMPFWQRFVGGVGLHETTTYLHDGWRGSHGCVNLLRADAQTLWGLGAIGTTVKVFGRRPGT